MVFFFCYNMFGNIISGEVNFVCEFSNLLIVVDGIMFGFYILF